MHLFENLGLSKPLIKAVAELGFETPTPVQEKVIPLLLNETADLVALSQTGTGKTAAFGLPLLSLLDPAEKQTQALILCPTRELCMQITRDLEAFAAHLKKVSITAVYGGASIVQQIQQLKSGSQIIVGTPGRMVDLIKRKKLHLDAIGHLVLDEADEMLNMGFKDDLDTILATTPDTKHTWLFSATMPDEVLRISRQYMHEPMEVTLGQKNQGNENIEHVFYPLRPRDRYAALKRLADYYPEMFGIVFCRTRKETQEIADRLIRDGYSADALHGDLSQSQRDHVMKRYRAHVIQLLVATDVAARGIDVDDITHVIHYSLPDELENYTHRSGRTARAGKKGISIALTGPADLGKIRIIERRVKKKFVKGSLPTADEVREKQLFRAVRNIQETIPAEGQFSELLPQIESQLGYLSREELIQRMLSIECSRMAQVNEQDIEEIPLKGGGQQGGDGRVKLFVNLGKYDNLNKWGLLSFLSEQSGVEERAMTIVEMKNSFSLVRVKADLADEMLSGLKDTYLGERPVHVEVRTGRAERNSGRREKNYKTSKKRYFEPGFEKRKKPTRKRNFKS